MISNIQTIRDTERSDTMRHYGIRVTEKKRKRKKQKQNKTNKKNKTKQKKTKKKQKKNGFVGGTVSSRLSGPPFSLCCG